MLKVAAITTDRAGCGWYRVRTPLMAAERQGLIKLRHTDDPGWNPALHAAYPGMPPEQQAAAAKMRDFYHMVGEWADIVFTQRYNQVQHGGGFQAMSRVMGVPWVLDVDDDVFHIDKVNPAYMTYRDKAIEEIADVREIASEDEAEGGEFVCRRNDGSMQAVRQKGWDYLKIARRCLKLADALIVSTEDLANQYGTFRRGEGVPERVFVVPNALDPVLWSAPTPAPPHPGEVWIGWAGAGSHLADLILLEKVVDAILTRHPETRFFWTRLPSPHLLRLSKKWGRRCVRLEAWSLIENWADYYTALNFDIALAPLEDTPFTRAKSNLKWLEAGILGQAMVASNCGPYARTIRHGQDGYLARSPSEWIDCVSRLVRSPTLRRGVGEAARRRVLAEYSMEHNAQRWVDVFQTIKDEYGPEIAARAKEVREKGSGDAVPDSDRHDSGGGAGSEGRTDSGQRQEGPLVGTA